MSASKKDPSWLKPTVDYGPIIVFFVVYLLSSNGKDNQQLLSATAAIMIATIVALIISLIDAKRVPMVPLVTAGIVGIFGGLTLWFKDDTFIKMKPTIVEALFSLILFGGLLFKKSLSLIPRCSPNPFSIKTSKPLEIYFLAISGVIDILFSNSLFSDMDPIIIITENYFCLALNFGFFLFIM